MSEGAFDPQRSARKKLLYVTGCGRSGTTIFGFCIGNAPAVLDLGEVMDFPRFRGVPNGFGPGTETYDFWQRVRGRMTLGASEAELSEFERLRRRYDTHQACVPVFVMDLLRLRPRGLIRYRDYLKSLYEAIFEESNAEFIVDSSKYPSHLLHLATLIPRDDLYVVHMIRDPIALAHAFGGGAQSRKRGLFGTAIYYMVVNFLALIAAQRVRRDRFLKIRYDDFVSAPEDRLAAIRDRFGIEVQPVVQRIDRKEPLMRGYLFNGNRLRLSDSVVFRREGGKKTSGESLAERFVAGFLRRIFW